MIRVHVICEGQTEETFVNDLLAPYFQSKDIILYPSLIGKSGHKGGNIQFQRLQLDVRNRVLRDSSAYCTTFLDYYALPPNFPGRSEATNLASIHDKAAHVGTALTEALTAGLGAEPMRRFIPYIQMHEFEALLFSSPAQFAQGIGEPRLEPRFQAIRSAFPTPEDINDSPQTAPSKRISALVPRYEKPLYGVLAALEIGLPVIRRECHLFDGWLTRLASLKAL